MLVCDPTASTILFPKLPPVLHFAAQVEIYIQINSSSYQDKEPSLVSDSFQPGDIPFEDSTISGREFAKLQGWEYWDLMNSTSYGPLYRHRTNLSEKITQVGRLTRPRF